MKLYVKANLNTDFHEISVSSINGGSKSELEEQLFNLLSQVPVNRYILVLGSKGYNTGYLKTNKNSFNWLYNDTEKDIGSYWDTSDTYIVLPKSFRPSSPINYDDDIVVVYEVFSSGEPVYTGLEDYEPMKDEDWKYCKELGAYYISTYGPKTIKQVYVKRKVER